MTWLLGYDVPSYPSYQPQHASVMDGYRREVCAYVKINSNAFLNSLDFIGRFK